MATAYHINARGEAAVCRAINGRCPFAAADEHHSTAEAARDAFEDKHKHAVVAPVRRRATPYSTGRSTAATQASAALATASQALSYGTPEARDRFAASYYSTTPRLQDRARPAADAPVRKLVLA